MGVVTSETTTSGCSCLSSCMTAWSRSVLIKSPRSELLASGCCSTSRFTSFDSKICFTMGLMGSTVSRACGRGRGREASRVCTIGGGEERSSRSRFNGFCEVLPDTTVSAAAGTGSSLSTTMRSKRTGSVASITRLRPRPNTTVVTITPCRMTETSHPCRSRRGIVTIGPLNSFTRSPLLDL